MTSPGQEVKLLPRPGRNTSPKNKTVDSVERNTLVDHKLTNHILSYTSVVGLLNTISNKIQSEDAFGR